LNIYHSDIIIWLKQVILSFLFCKLKSLISSFVFYSFILNNMNLLSFIPGELLLLVYIVYIFSVIWYPTYLCITIEIHLKKAFWSNSTIRKLFMKISVIETSKQYLFSIVMLNEHVFEIIQFISIFAFPFFRIRGRLHSYFNKGICVLL